MITRPGRDSLLMDTARLWAQRSTCARLQVGCVISRDGRILVQGYNGSPSGLPHCDGDHEPEECRAVHAEQAAIAHAARNGVALDGATIHVTNMPCLSCARSIINAGIKIVVYAESYRLRDGVELLIEAGVKVGKIRPSSSTIDTESEEG